jgi:hypothetical protein
MGLFSWLLDEVAEVLSDSSSSDFVDPLEQGQQIINNDPVLSGVQETMSRVSEIYEQAMGTSEVPSSNESTRQTISAVMNASPVEPDERPAGRHERC